jgi:hypothetical protein
MVHPVLKTHKAEVADSFLLHILSGAPCYPTRDANIFQRIELREQMVELEYKTQVLVSETG